ncbi:MAG: hypothetical protein ACLR0U_25600 [Enterocloster clostridioformis]
MDRNEIYEMVITEMSEEALRERKESCSEKEKQLYKDASELSRKRTDVLEAALERGSAGAGGLPGKDKSDSGA